MQVSLLQLPDELLGNIAGYLPCKDSFNWLRCASKALAHSPSVCQRVQHVVLLDRDKDMGPCRDATHMCAFQNSEGVIRDNAMLAVSWCPPAARPRKLTVASGPYRMVSLLDELTRVAT